MKCRVEYVVTVWWKHLGKCEYRFTDFHIAYELIRFVRERRPDIKITCKSEGRTLNIG